MAHRILRITQSAKVTVKSPDHKSQPKSLPPARAVSAFAKQTRMSATPAKKVTIPMMRKGFNLFAFTTDGFVILEKPGVTGIQEADPYISIGSPGSVLNLKIP